MKRFTIVRKRNVIQIQTDQIDAETEQEALEIANNGTEWNDGNEWVDLDDCIEYPELTSDDVLEVNEVEDW